MAKPTTKAKKTTGKSKKEMYFPFGKENFIIIGIGIVVLIIGYIFLSQSPLDGTGPMVIAPIFLVLGYCVIIPYGILKKPKSEEPAVEETEAAPVQTSATTASGLSSNIKTS